MVYVKENISFINALPIKSVSNISFFERIMKYKFPTEYVSFIKENNGCMPIPKMIQTSVKERSVHRFLSFNPDDKLNIFSFNKNNIASEYIAFACDELGNCFCFCKNSENIYYFDNMEICNNKYTGELIADSFSEFLTKLN